MNCRYIMGIFIGLSLWSFPTFAQPGVPAGSAPDAAAAPDAGTQPPRGPRPHRFSPMTPANLPPASFMPPPEFAVCRDRNGDRDFKPGITGGLRKEVIWRTIRQHASDVESCLAGVVDNSPKLTGRVGMHWLLERDGSVIKVFLKSSTLHNAMLESCLAAKIQGWSFPRGQNAGMGQVRHWFVFENGKYVEEYDL